MVGPTLGRPDTKGKGERENIDGSDIEVRAVFACGAIIRGSDRRGARSKQGLVNRTIFEV